MREMTNSLVDQGSREDLPTGSTPRKRVWQYTDNWELTKERESIIQDWKRRGVQLQDNGSDSESSSSRRRIPPERSPASLKQLPLPSVADQPEDISESELQDPLPPPYLEADPARPLTSNIPLSLAPSAIQPIALPSTVSNPATKAKIGKAGSDAIHAMGTLTERSTNLIYSRGTRRVRG
jgi:kinesin family member 11